MLATVMGAMATVIAREIGTPAAGGEEAPAPAPTDGLASMLIGSGASLLARRDRRPVGLVLLAAGGVLLWRQAVAAEKRRGDALKPARVRPAPPLRPGASAAAG